MMEAQALVVHLVESFEYAPDPNTKNNVVVSVEVPTLYYSVSVGFNFSSFFCSTPLWDARRFLWCAEMLKAEFKSLYLSKLLAGEM